MLLQYTFALANFGNFKEIGRVFVKTMLMLLKEQVLETVQALPSEFSLDELVERLILLEKIQIGLRQVEEGNVKTMEEAKETLYSGFVHTKSK